MCAMEIQEVYVNPGDDTSVFRCRYCGTPRTISNHRSLACRRVKENKMSKKDEILWLDLETGKTRSFSPDPVEEATKWAERGI